VVRSKAGAPLLGDKESAKLRMREYRSRKKQGGRVPKDVEITDGFNPLKIDDPLSRAEKKELNAVLKDAENDASLSGVSRMLEDLRYGYQYSVGPTGKKGKQRLEELMQSDSEFKFAVRELLKIEGALLAAKIRKEGDNSGATQQNVFVVLKGLDEDKKYIEMFDKTVDLKQISRATNPDGSELE
jgi:NurA-like 5'-3' nuclease